MECGGNQVGFIKPLSIPGSGLRLGALTAAIVVAGCVSSDSSYDLRYLTNAKAVSLLTWLTFSSDLIDFEVVSRKLGFAPKRNPGLQIFIEDRRVAGYFNVFDDSRPGPGTTERLNYVARDNSSILDDYDAHYPANPGLVSYRGEIDFTFNKKLLCIKRQDLEVHWGKAKPGPVLPPQPAASSSDSLDQPSAAIRDDDTSGEKSGYFVWTVVNSKTGNSTFISISLSDGCVWKIMFSQSDP